MKATSGKLIIDLKQAEIYVHVMGIQIYKNPMLTKQPVADYKYQRYFHVKLSDFYRK